MHQRTKGQSLVEMALMLPLLVLILFGTIDLGYYLYGYATIYEAARNGSEKASLLPPYPAKLNDSSDACVSNIMREVQKGAVLFPDLASRPGGVTISYPGTRALGQPIEVTVTYNIEPLTPIWQFVMFGNNGQMTVSSTSRRSIESLGNNPNAPNLVACQQ